MFVQLCFDEERKLRCECKSYKLHLGPYSPIRRMVETIGDAYRGQFERLIPLIQILPFACNYTSISRES